jgi:uncharacterized protein YndB with AHSA1/START domain/uncharacterized protein YciI
MATTERLNPKAFRQTLGYLLLFAFVFGSYDSHKVFAKNEGSGMTQPQYYLGKLIGTRPTWPNDMTPDEEKIMEEHFLYLKSLVNRKKVVMAGPVMLEPPFGLVILKTASREEADSIMSNDPSVKHGLHTYEVGQMVLSLLLDYRNPDRYPKEQSDKVIYKEVIVKAPRNDVWKAWTTTEGLKSFFSEVVKMELRVGGPFEIYFGPESAVGMRGSEDCKILSFLPQEMLSFEWNAPPDFGDLRYQFTRVVIMFESVDSAQTKVRFTQLGWGKGEGWEKVYDYFDKAWAYVLSNLQKSFAVD